MGGKDDDTLDPKYTIADEILRRKIQESLDDPRPCIPAKEVFDKLERKHAERMKAKNAYRPPR